MNKVLKGFPFFCAILLAMAVCPSLAEFDYTPYLLGENHWPDHIAIWNEKDYAVSGLISSEARKGGNLRQMVWYRDRKEFRELTLERTGDDGCLRDYIPLARPDGTCGVICGYRSPSDSLLNIAVYDWSENGLTDPVSITSCAIRRKLEPICGDNWFAFLEQSPSGTVLCVADGYGGVLQRAVIPEEKAGDLSRCAVSADGSRAAAVITDGSHTDWFMYILQNQVIWMHEFPEMFLQAAIDRGGGILVTSMSNKIEDQYRPLCLEYYGPEGQLLWLKTLSGDRVVIFENGIRFDTSSDCAVINGIAQANSRHFYRMFRLMLDRQGNMADLDVRNCDYHGSYVLDVTASFNTDLFYGIASGHPAALVSFGDLPEGSESGLKLRDIKIASETGVYVYYNPDGGIYYHADAYCPSVNKKYTPLTPIPFEKINTQAYANLMRCRKCNAPERPEW